MQVFASTVFRSEGSPCAQTYSLMLYIVCHGSVNSSVINCEQKMRKTTKAKRFLTVETRFTFLGSDPR